MSSTLRERENLAQNGEKVSLLKALKPFQIVSLLDMIEFDLITFSQIMNRLQYILQDLHEKQKSGTPLTPEERTFTFQFLNSVRVFCSQYEIDIEGDADRALGVLDDTQGWKYHPHVYVLALRNHINDELRKRLFMFIPTEEAGYYNQFQLFGSSVALKFPKANLEITEAGNCYATGSYTACVFHLMRAVEVGARKLISALHASKYLNPPNRPVELCTWDDLLKALDKGVADKAAGTRTDATKKATYEFYNHVVAQFRNFKDAWRNNVSHKRETYQQGKAKDIMDNARQFMQHIAKRLKE